MKSTLPPTSQFFSREGILAKHRGPHHEFRPSQLKMAVHVEHALIESHHLIAEAGTGTGKTLAYLYPAARYAQATGKRVILSTATKALQEQILNKDVPMLQELFPELSFSCLKGRDNYLCKQKLEDHGSLGLFPDQAMELHTIREWAAVTETGDSAEIQGLSEQSITWAKLSARGDACTGTKCRLYQTCHLTRARERALESNIVIVNHHLLLTDIALRVKNPDAGLIPSGGAAILDEAHEIEDIASACFGVSLSHNRCTDLARSLQLHAALAEKDQTVGRLAASLSNAFAAFWSTLPGELAGRLTFEDRQAFLRINKDNFMRVLEHLSLIHNRLAPHEEVEGVQALARRTEAIYSSLRYLLESDDKDTVFWIERRPLKGGAGFHVSIEATPIDVSAMLETALFDRFKSVIVTSATLSVAGKFDHIRKRYGISEATELLVASPFDYQNQALLYVPKDMPDPRAPEHFDRAVQETKALLDASSGRAFCLFTSYDAMQRMHRALTPLLPYPLLLHGTASRTKLLEEFRTLSHPVLFATSSFWQGVDVQGEQLSCVIIDRLPFAVPSDPVVQARTRAATTAEVSGFAAYQIPRAAIALKQGFGRLIRSASDRGILAILDPRIQHPRYGRSFLASLPAYPVTAEFESVKRFMQSELSGFRTSYHA